MSFKNLLVFADDSDPSTLRLDTAIAMAERHDAKLSAFALTGQPAYHYGIGSEVAVNIYAEEVEEAKAVARDAADLARARLAGCGHDGDTRWATGTPEAIAGIAARHARYADLSLVGQPFAGAHESLLTKVFEGILFDSGRPFVMVPRAWSGDGFGERILIAWMPRKEAARAVADAMPFIEAADSVHIVMVDPKTGDDAHGEEPGADLAAALSRHDVPVTVDALPRAGQSVSGRLLTHADDCDASLIVMGGYGHWRLRESLFGGVTRDIIRESTVPLLMAH